MTAGELNLRNHMKLPSASSRGTVSSNASIPANSFSRQIVKLQDISYIVEALRIILAMTDRLAQSTGDMTAGPSPLV